MVSLHCTVHALRVHGSCDCFLGDSAFPFSVTVFSQEEDDAMDDAIEVAAYEGMVVSVSGSLGPGYTHRSEWRGMRLDHAEYPAFWMSLYFQQSSSVRHGLGVSLPHTGADPASLPVPPVPASASYSVTSDPLIKVTVRGRGVSQGNPSGYGKLRVSGWLMGEQVVLRVTHTCDPEFVCEVRLDEGLLKVWLSLQDEF